MNIPIELTSAQATASRSNAYSVGIGGLSLHTKHKLLPGVLVHVKIPYLHPAFETDARVVWCHDVPPVTKPGAKPGCEADVETGIEFLNSDDAYRARMVEQICHIENYRLQVNTQEGRKLSAEDAAIEWISKFAADFPDLE